MYKRIFTSKIAALAFFTVVGLVAALAIAWPNLARAHSPGGASLTALTVSAGGTTQTFSPTFSSTVYSYTVHVDNSVAQVTVLGTPDGDGTVAYQYTDADSGTDGHQVNLPTLGGKLINVVVSHTDSGQLLPQLPTTQIYTVLVIREGTVATDRAALMALYNSTGGANWNDNTNWGTTEPLDDWYQVYTNADGRVHALGLAQNNLRGTLPDALGNLDQMLQLYLWSNRLSGPIPASLGGLTNLTELSISANELTGPIPDELGSLTNLTHLWLHRNRLSGQIPTTLGSLTDLTILWLFDNRLSGSIPASLGSLTDLQQLYLNQNNLDGSIPASLGSLANLEHLYLYDNLLSGSIPASLGSLTKLTDLQLKLNQLSGSIPGELGNLTKLTHLRLQINQLRRVDPGHAGQPHQPGAPDSS